MLNFQHILIRAFTLFLLLDPIGNVPMYVVMLKKLPPKRQILVILRELIFALFVIIAFYEGGDAFLTLLELKPETIQISGGAILLIIATTMLFPKPHNEETEQVLTKKNNIPYFVPLAVPLIAGPAVLAAVMIYSHQHVTHVEGILAIALAWLVTTLILITSPFLNKILGEKGLITLERIMGLILVLFAFQMLMEGLTGFYVRIHS
ncbi:MAG: hypothetical protein S4CHLAM37_09280 [Chlamydiia bacterium]|nr:hypothetical protein [Chlamydiia bacterium]